MWHYTITLHAVKKAFALTDTDYAIIDCIGKLAEISGWCTASNAWIGEAIGCTAKNVLAVIAKGKKKGLIEEAHTEKKGVIVPKKATALWANAVSAAQNGINLTPKVIGNLTPLVIGTPENLTPLVIGSTNQPITKGVRRYNQRLQVPITKGYTYNNTYKNTYKEEEKVKKEKIGVFSLVEDLPEIPIPLNAFSLPEEKEKNSAKKEKKAAEELEFNPAAENIKRLQLEQCQNLSPLPTFGLDYSKINWGGLEKPLISILSDYYTQRQGSSSKLSNIAVQRSVDMIERILTTLSTNMKIKTLVKANEVLLQVLETVVTNGYAFSERLLLDMACKQVAQAVVQGSQIKAAHIDKVSMADAYFKMSQK